jgi:hypothetical protein
MQPNFFSVKTVKGEDKVEISEVNNELVLIFKDSFDDGPKKETLDECVKIVKEKKDACRKIECYINMGNNFVKLTPNSVQDQNQTSIDYKSALNAFSNALFQCTEDAAAVGCSTTIYNYANKIDNNLKSTHHPTKFEI